MKSTILIRSTETKTDVFSNGLPFEEAVAMLEDAMNMVCVSQGRYELEAKQYVLRTLIAKFKS